MERELQRSDLVKILSENIRARRTELGMSQQELADKTGVSRPYIAQLESAVRAPVVDVLAPLADALATTPDALLTSGVFSHA